MAERESPLRKSLKHESGRLHVSGKARYVDDFPAPAELLYAKPIMATEAHAKILSIDLERARGLAGVHAILLAEDIPGLNDASPFAHDEPLLADGMVHCMGQAIGLVVAETEDICFDAMARIEVEYETLDPILTIRDAIEVDSILGEVQVIERGDVDKLLERAAIRLSGEVESGGQDHFYLETHAAQALPDDRGGFHVQSSTQHPSEVQAKVAELLNLGRHEVVVSCPRMGGAFGGKETQAARVAEYAALAAHHTGRPVRVRLNRDEDMIHTGKRHPWYSRYDVGFDHRGVLLALDVQTYADGGWATDLSGAILQRCLFHLDHAYFVPAARFVGKVARTNTVSNTAFRGFGGPQGALVIESILNDVAEALELDPAEVRRRNFYGPSPRHVTPYGQVVTPDDNRLERIYDELMLSSSYSKRRLAIQAFNANSEWVKRGIGFQPVKFGISFTTSMLNQAGALVLVYADGTVQLNHGGTEMGQGLHTKMLAICAHELGVELEAIRVMDTATDKVPNTSATAASSGSDLNGQAVRNACQTIRERLRPVAAKLLGVGEGLAGAIIFQGGVAFVPGLENEPVLFSDIVGRAYVEQISLSATGYYRTPNIYYDAKRGRGRPFHYYAYGGAVVEMEVCGLTGESRMLRADVLHDCGNSLIPSIDRGQVEGGFVQGVGWLTCEEVIFNEQGKLLTHAPSTYKIPALGDVPEDFRVCLLEGAPQEGVIHRSKAVGEPPFILGIGAVTALRHAVAAFAEPGYRVELALPATPEAILRAVELAKVRQIAVSRTA